VGPWNNWQIGCKEAGPKLFGGNRHKVPYTAKSTYGVLPQRSDRKKELLPKKKVEEGEGNAVNRAERQISRREKTYSSGP